MTVETGASSLRLEAQVAVRDDADQLSPSTTGTPEMFLARVSSITSRIVVSGVTVIGSWMTPLSNFLTRCTSRAWAFERHVLVDDADAAFLRHRDREARLGDGVHRGRHDRHVEADGAGEVRGQVDVARQEVGVSGDEEDVVEGERFLENAHGWDPAYR